MCVLPCGSLFHLLLVYCAMTPKAIGVDFKSDSITSSNCSYNCTSLNLDFLFFTKHTKITNRKQNLRFMVLEVNVAERFMCISEA